MPIYEYECEECGNRIERLIRNAGDVPKACEKCKGRLRKALSSFSVSSTGPGAKHEPSAACSTCSSGSCPYSGGP